VLRSKSEGCEFYADMSYLYHRSCNKDGPLLLRIWARRESESGLELLGAGGFVQPEVEGGN
jgi:hypothetical protein